MDNFLKDCHIPDDDDNDWKYCEDCGKRIRNDIDDNSYCKECAKKREEA